MFNSILRVTAIAALLSSGSAGFADGLAGPYLAANHANIQNDYTAAARFYSEALQKDPNNPYLLQNALLSLVAKGEVETGVEYAKRIEESGRGNQLSDLVILSSHIKEGDFDAAARVLSKSQDRLTELLHGLMTGWVELGRGKMALAAVKFDQMKEPAALALFGQYHKALALASVGDFESADTILQGDEQGNLRLNRGSLIAHAQILSQLERKDDAIKLLSESLNGTRDQELTDLRDAIQEQGVVDYNFVADARDGASEVFFTLASALNNDNSDYSSLLYSRLAHYLRPDSTPSILLAAEILRNQEQYDLATRIYSKVPQDNPMFLNAELGRADTLIDADKPDAAVEVLRGLTRSHGDIPRVHMSLGDALRAEEEYADALLAYQEALKTIDKPAENHWFLFYAMGISAERTDDWDEAESYFRKALELKPGQPLVLNYLGYTLVENRMKLEEAQKMIEDAVAARPDSGFITDSLGWVRYRLGKFEEAVEPMERAVELMPVDPIINDHLGDVYWKVGRKREAEFQWKRALSFDPEDKEKDRIKRKLDVGLDVVLEAEAKLEAASNGGN